MKRKKSRDATQKKDPLEKIVSEGVASSGFSRVKECMKTTLVLLYGSITHQNEATEKLSKEMKKRFDDNETSKIEYTTAAHILIAGGYLLECPGIAAPSPKTVNFLERNYHDQLLYGIRIQRGLADEWLKSSIPLIQYSLERIGYPKRIS